MGEFSSPEAIQLDEFNSPEAIQLKTKFAFENQNEIFNCEK